MLLMLYPLFMPMVLVLSLSVIIVGGLIGLVYLAFKPATQLFGATIYQGPTDEPKRVALTFDDGPYGSVTTQILDILQAKGVKATFFVVGQNAQRYPDILQRQVHEGHTIGNHTLDHSRWLAVSRPSTVEKNLRAADHVIAGITGYHPRFFRPPHGVKSPLLLRTVHRLGYHSILWNASTFDYSRYQSAYSLTRSILRQLQPGAIIDLHDGRDTHPNYPRNNLIQALPELIDAIHNQGYRFVTLDQLLGESAYFAQQLDERP